MGNMLWYNPHEMDVDDYIGRAMVLVDGIVYPGKLRYKNGWYRWHAVIYDGFEDVENRIEGWLPFPTSSENPQIIKYRGE
jgi:hypothetical protein